MHRLPARSRKKTGEILVGRVRHIEHGAPRVARCAGRIHVTPGSMLLSRLLFDALGGAASVADPWPTEPAGPSARTRAWFFVAAFELCCGCPAVTRSR